MQWAVACIILGVANDNATTRGGGNSSFKRRVVLISVRNQAMDGGVSWGSFKAREIYGWHH